MGNSLTMHEAGGFDSHPEIQTPYVHGLDSEKVYQDMTHPLSSYFISSGHNSYLTGDQLLAKSGTDTIELVRWTAVLACACLRRPPGWPATNAVIFLPDAVVPAVPSQRLPRGRAGKFV